MILCVKFVGKHGTLTVPFKSRQQLQEDFVAFEADTFTFVMRKI